jgi:hypothetical protein
MADANHKGRSSSTKPHAHTYAVLGSSPDRAAMHSPGTHLPFMPWMQIADLWLGCVGFSPGQRVHIIFDYRNACLSITPDHG